MIINNSNVNKLQNNSLVSQINAQYANKLAQSRTVNKALTELSVKNMDAYAALNQAPENQVMTGLTSMADVYRAFEHSFSSVMDPITKEAEKNKKAIMENNELTSAQKDEKIAELTKSYAADVKKAASDLSSVYDGMLGGLKQVYSGNGMLEQVIQEYGDIKMSDLSLTMQDLELENVDKEIAMDDIKASIERAREEVRQERKELMDIGKDFGLDVIKNNQKFESKQSVESLLKSQSNMFSQSLNSMMYASMASPYKTLNNTISTMFNLSSQFSRVNVLI